MPSSFESSSGVRWFAMTLLPVQQKSPSARRASRASSKLPRGCRQESTGLPSQHIHQQSMYYLVRTEAKQLEERFAEVEGTRLRYLVGGAGSPLCLVHGLGGAGSNWVELA